MKKFILLFVLAISFTVYAQEEIKEGTLKMKVTMSSENPQINSSLAVMGDITASSSFKGEKSRTEMSSPMMGNNTTIVDNTDKTVLVLMDNPMAGKKFMKQEIKDDDEALKDITVKENGETRNILGYECKGYDVTMMNNGIDTKMTLYVTDKIKAYNQNSLALGDKIKGFPLLSVVKATQNGMPITTTAEVIELKKGDIDDALFDMTIPEGYTELKMPGK